MKYSFIHVSIILLRSFYLLISWLELGFCGKGDSKFTPVAKNKQTNISTWCKHYNFPNMRYIWKTSTLKNNKVCTLYQTIGEIIILCPFSLNKNPKMLPCLSLTTVKITWSLTWMPDHVAPTYIKTSHMNILNKEKTHKNPICKQMFSLNCTRAKLKVHNMGSAL